MRQGSRGTKLCPLWPGKQWLDLGAGDDEHVLHDISGADIKWGDTLGSPLLLEGDRLKTFEVNVANPPFSLDKWALRTPATTASNASGRIAQEQGGLCLYLAHD